MTAATLVQALFLATARFADYASLHAAKEPPAMDKALANAEMGAICAAAMESIWRPMSEMPSDRAVLIRSAEVPAGSPFGYPLAGWCVSFGQMGNGRRAGLWAGTQFYPESPNPNEMSMRMWHSWADAPPMLLPATVAEVKGVLGAVANAGARDLLATCRALLVDAMENHIYDAINGEEPAPGCGYAKAVADIEFFLGPEPG